MPDALYDTDILSWSEQQSDLLRRLAQGERVNDAIDWDNLIDEVETVGRNEIRACESLLGQAFLHLLKLHMQPESEAANHWRSEVLGFLASARRAFAPSMRQRIPLDEIYADAVRQARALFGGRFTGPTDCPFQWDDLLAVSPDIAALQSRLMAEQQER